MHIAILGATSQIAKDLIFSYSARDDITLTLFARSPEAVMRWLQEQGLNDRYVAANIQLFGAQESFDAVINFVGVGNPAQTAAMGSSILDLTLQYDELALTYVKHHPNCRYLFLSSGAAYGSAFNEPVTQASKASVAINNLLPQDWYAVAKLYAECRHRALPQFSVVDIRIFNYFSHTQDMDARFLITDIVRAIRDKTVLKTSSDNIVRDYLNPVDFYQLVDCILSSNPANLALDCYSQAPIDKMTLLQTMKDKFGLQYEILPSNNHINATGAKFHYYSNSRKSEEFGYFSKLTSLQGVLREVSMYFSNVLSMAV